MFHCYVGELECNSSIQFMHVTYVVDTSVSATPPNPDSQCVLGPSFIRDLQKFTSKFWVPWVLGDWNIPLKFADCTHNTVDDFLLDSTYQTTPKKVNRVHQPDRTSERTPPTRVSPDGVKLRWEVAKMLENQRWKYVLKINCRNINYWMTNTIIPSGVKRKIILSPRMLGNSPFLKPNVK